MLKNKIIPIKETFSEQGEKKWQKDLSLFRNLLKKPANWQPKIKLLPWMVRKEFITRFYLRNVLKLLTLRNEEIRTRIKELFSQKEVDLREIIKLLNEKKTVRELKTRRLSVPKDKIEKVNNKEIKFYTFNTFKDSSNITYYSLFDGKKKLKLTKASNFFDYLLNSKTKDETIVLFGWNSLSHSILHPLLQEAILRGFFPTVKGGKDKVGSCYLKGNSIIIKDANKFHLEKNKKTEKIEELYRLIQKLDKKTKNKYQISILDKNVSTLAKIAWKDFWNNFEKERDKHNWENIWDLNKIEDEFIRKSFHGGYLDMFNEQNYRGTVSDWDFKSFYPSVMARYSFPTSRPEWINHPQDFYGKDWKKDFYGFYKCEIECLPDNIYPFFTQKNDDKENKFHIYRPGKYQAVLFSEEIKFFWHHTPKIKITVGEGYFFRNCHYIFRNWIRKMYMAKKKGDQSAKIKMNSLYGMFSTEKEQFPLIWSENKTKKTVSEFRTKDRKKIYLNSSEEPKHSWKFTNVAIAAAITSHARIILYQALLANWDNLLYCATDGFALKGVENKYQADPIFADCGALEKKGEYQGFVSLAPNVYAFKNDKGKLIGKGFLKDIENNKFDFLFQKKITKENREEIWSQIPERSKWGMLWIQILKEASDDKGKKKLIDGKWTIISNQENIKV